MLDLPIEPILAKAVTAIPEGDYSYEPKWDGFRCLIIRDGDQIELGSRSKKPLTRYFPEVVEFARSLPERCIVDGELVIVAGEAGASHLSWDLLSQRIHLAESRVTLLASSTPAEFIAFDLLWLSDDDLTELPFQARRDKLKSVFATPPHPSLHLTATTRDAAVARTWFEQFEGAGLDGVIAKPLASPYRQGKRDLLKIKHKRTADAVVVGYRVAKSGEGVGSLLLGLYDGAELKRVGGIVGLPAAARMELVDELAPLVIDQPASLQKPPSRFGGKEDWVALEPKLVVEVAFDQLEGDRFRHAVSLLRWRPDKARHDCTLDQVERPVAYDLRDVLQA